jgi:transketolase
MESRLDHNELLKLKTLCVRVRRSLLKMALASGPSHLSSSLSIVEILAALYGGYIDVDRVRGLSDNRDRVILSKGHAAMCLYAVFAEVGLIDRALLEEFSLCGAPLSVHPFPSSPVGIEAGSGSLGHGVALGAGLALASKLRSIAYRVFVILGDGECQEGAIWEAAQFCSHWMLDNLTIIVDENGCQSLSRCEDVVGARDLVQMWAAFGWNSVWVDGHDLGEILNSITLSGLSKPTAIIARTVRGKGAAFLEGDSQRHFASITSAQYDAAVAQLNLLELQMA